MSSFLCMQRSVWGRLGGLLSVVVAFGRTARAWWLDLIFSSLALTSGCCTQGIFLFCLIHQAGWARLAICPVMGVASCSSRTSCVHARYDVRRGRFTTSVFQSGLRSLHKIREEIYRKLLENLGPRKHRAISSSRTN